MTYIQNDGRITTAATSDAPERIWAWSRHSDHKDGWRLHGHCTSDPEFKEDDPEYIRADLVEARIAAAEAAALERAARVADEHLARVQPHDPDDKNPADKIAQGYGNASLNIGVAIRALITPDRLGALEARDAWVRAEEREACAKVAHDIGSAAGSTNEEWLAADIIEEAIRERGE